MDIFWFAIGAVVGYVAVTTAANIEVRRMHKEFETWKEKQR